MGTTPEGKIKKQVKALLAEFEPHGLYQYWPVPAGYGASSLDCLVCYMGFFIAIETKAPGEKPTPRQHLTIEQVRASLGHACVVDGEESLKSLRVYLEYLTTLYKRKT